MIISSETSFGFPEEYKIDFYSVQVANPNSNNSYKGWWQKAPAG